MPDQLEMDQLKGKLPIRKVPRSAAVPELLERFTGLGFGAIPGKIFEEL